MSKKLNVAIFDNDLRCEIKKHEVSEDGTKIRIKSGGEGHFMPTFDNDSFLEFPRRKKYLLFGEKVYNRYYIVKKRAAACVNFKTEPPKIGIPDPEQLKQANMNFLATQVGKDRSQDVPWYAWIQLALIGFLVLMQMGVIG